MGRYHLGKSGWSEQEMKGVRKASQKKCLELDPKDKSDLGRKGRAVSGGGLLGETYGFGDGPGSWKQSGSGQEGRGMPGEGVKAPALSEAVQTAPEVFLSGHFLWENLSCQGCSARKRASTFGALNRVSVLNAAPASCPAVLTAAPSYP